MSRGLVGKSHMSRRVYEFHENFIGESLYMEEVTKKV